jgi:hypothetical protein
MKKAHDTEICDGCGESKILAERDTNEFCEDCLLVLDTLKKNPQLLQRLCKLTKIKIPSAAADNDVTAKSPRDLPDVLDAVRYRTRDREQNTWYVSISEIEGDPVEIFASTAFDRDHHLQSRISNLTTITRLISLILRHIYLDEVLTLDKTLKQLMRSSRQKNDLPEMLSNVLGNYRKNQDKGMEK